MHLIGQKVFTILRMLIFPATEICAELCCQSTWGYLPQLSATFEPLLLYVAYLSSCFGNSKMVTECEPKPISMNFGSPRRGEGGSCVEGMVQNWIGQKKKTILATISYLFLLQYRFDQSYATNLLWNIFPNFLPNFRLEGGI